MLNFLFIEMGVGRKLYQCYRSCCVNTAQFRAIVGNYTQKNFRNACYQVGFFTEGISTGAAPQDRY